MLLRYCGLICTGFVFVFLTYGVKESAAFQGDGSPAQIAVDQEKALKYHAALQRRPNPGYLYDRFYNSWLDSSSLDELEKFLTDQATTSAATNDRLLLAFFFAKQGKDVQALEQFRVALENDPTSAETWYEKAVIEARTLDFETALADLGKAQAANPKKDVEIKVAKLRGKLFVRNQQIDKAIAVWDELVSENPSDDGLMEDMIELQISEGLYEQAEKLCDKLIGITKDPYQLVMRKLRKGDIIQRSGDRTQALAIYGETLNKVGMDSWLEREILSQIEQLFRREDDLTGLSEHYQKLIKATPKRMGLRKSFGKLQLELGQSDEAIKTYQEIVELTPGDRTNRESLISILAGAGQTEKAIKQTQSLIQQFPKDAELDVQLAILFSSDKKSDEAGAAIQSFLTKSGENEYAYLRAANLLNRFELSEKAEETYKTCVEKFPESSTAKESYAAYLYEHEKKPAAIAIWNELVQGGDREQVVRVARILTSRREHQAAFDLLNARYDEFKLDSIYLGQLCTEAIALKKFAEATPWSKQRVKLSKNYGDLETSVAQAVQIIKKTDTVDDEIKALEGAAKRGVPSTCLLAALLESTGDSERSDTLIQTAIDSIRGGAEVESRVADLQMLASQQVRMLKSRQDWTAAAAAVKAMIEMPGGRKSVNIQQLVELYLRDGNLESALNWTGEWKKISPGSLLPWFNESQILTRMGRSEDSINVLRVAAQKFTDPELYARLADRYVSNGQYKDAERIYWRQYDESEKLSDKLRWAEQLANLNIELGETSEFFKRLEERQRSNPNSIEPLLALAQAHRIADNYEERRKWLLEATRVQPDNLPLLQEIARLEESEGEWEKAIATLRTAEKLDSTSRTKQKIARLYLEYGESQKGFSILLEIAGGSQANAREIEKIVDAIFGTGEHEEALRFIRPQIERFPNDYRLVYQLGVIQEELGLLDEATQSFISVLKMKSDISGLIKPANNNQFRMQISAIEGMMPKELMEILGLVYVEGTAYAHREDGGYGGGFSPLGGAHTPGVNIQLPYKAEDSHNYATCHLVQIARELEEDAVTALTTNLKNVGVQNAELLFSFEGSMSQIFEDCTSLLEEFPDNKALLASSIMSSMRGPGGSGGSDETIVKAYETFKDSHPELAFLGAMSAANADEKHRGMLSESLEGMKEVETPSFITLSGVAQLLRMNSMGESNASLSKEQTAEVNQLLVKWYPKLQGSNNQMSMWVFASIYSALESGESAEAYIQFMDEEAARPQKQQLGGAFGMTMPSRGGNSGMVKMITFPPQELVHFPSSLLSSLNFSDEDHFGFMGEESISLEEWAKKFGDSVSQAKNPTLRALLQTKAALANPDETVKPINERFTAAKATIAELLKSERPDIDAYLLAIGIATQEERWTDASGLLEKARSLPLSRAMRQTIDGALVAIATQGGIDLKQDANKNIVSSAKAAALRLRRGRLQQEQRLELVGVFETLGLTKEAEKLEEKIAQGPSNPGIYRGGAPTPATPPERIRKLIDDGKTDAAVRLLSQQFKAKARQELTLNSMNHNRWEMEEFKRNLSGYRVTDNLLETLDPGDSKVNSKQNEFGYAQEVFGDKAKAIEIYRQSLAANEKQDGVRVRLMLLELETDSKALGKHFAKIQKRSRAAAGISLSVLFYDDELLNFDKKIRIFDSVADYLAELTDSESQDLSWVSNLLSNLTNQMNYDSDEYLSSIYARKKVDEESEEGKENKKLVASRQKRFDTHQKLCRTMLSIPQLAPEGFSSLLAATEADGQEVGTEFLELAKSAIINFKAPKSMGGISMTHQIVSHSYYGEENENLVEVRSPQTFIIQHFGLLDAPDRSAQFDKVIAEIEAARGDKVIQPMKREFGLYLLNADQFAAEAKDFIEQAAADANRLMKTEAKKSALSTVIKVWSKREIESNLTDLVIEQKKGNTSSRGGFRGYGYNDNTTESSYLKALAKRGDTSEVERCLKELSIVLLGPEEQQVEFVKKNGQQNGRQTKEMIKVREYTELISNLIGRPGLVGPCLNEVQRLDLLNAQPGSLNYQIQSVLDGIKEADQLLETLESVSLLGELKDFDPFFFKNSEPSTVWGNALQQFRWQSDDLNKAAAAKLEEKKELRFGEKVVLMVLKSEYSSVEFHELLGQNLEQLQSLDPQRTLAIATFDTQLASSFSRDVSEEDPSENAKLAEKVLKKALGTSANKDFEKLMAAKRLQDLGVEEWELDDWVGNVLSRVDHSEAEQISEAFVKVSKWLEKSNSHSSHYSQSNPASGLLTSIIKEPNYDSLRLIIELLNNDDDIKVRIDGSLTRRIDGFLKQEFNRLGKIAKNKSKNQKLSFVKTLDNLYRELGRQLPDQDTTEFLPAYVSFLVDFKQRLDFAKLNEWAELESNGGKYPQVAQNWKLALALTQSYLENKPKESSEDSQAEPIPRDTEATTWQTEWCRLITDETRPLGLRVDTAETLFTLDSTLPAANVWQCVETIAKGSKSDLSGSDIFTALFDVVRKMDDPNFKENAEELSAAWQRNAKESYLQPRQILAAVRFFHAMEKPTAINKLIRQQEENISDPRLLGELIQLGYSKLALGAWRRNGVNVNSVNQLENSKFNYTSSFHTALPEFLALLPNDGAKFVAEVYFSSFADSEDATEKHSTDRETRLQDLTKRFADTKFPNKSDRELCLVILKDASNAGEHIMEPLKEIGEKMRTLDLWQRNSYEDYYDVNQQLMAAYVGLSLREGDVQPFFKLQELLTEGQPDDSDYEYENMVRMIYEALAPDLASHLSQCDQQQMAALLPEFRKLAQPREENYRRDTTESLNLFAHIVAGKLDEYDAWLKTFDEEEIENRNISVDQLWEMSSQFVKSSAESVPEEKRFEMTRKIWQYCKDAECEIGSDHYRTGVQASCSGCSKSKFGLEAAIEAELLTEELFASRGNELAEINPVDGESWSQLGRQQLKLEQLEQAAVSFQQALTDSKKNMKKAIANRRVELADVLHQLGKTKEAKAKLKKVKENRLYGEYAEKYILLKAELGDFGKSKK